MYLCRMQNWTKRQGNVLLPVNLRNRDFPRDYKKRAPWNPWKNHETVSFKPVDYKKIYYDFELTIWIVV